MPKPIRSQTQALEDRRLIPCGDWLVSQELYRDRQSQNLSFDQSWSWVWVVQRGSAVLELGESQRQYFLDSADTNFVYATDRQQQFTVTRAPLLLTRLRLPVKVGSGSAAFATSGHAELPLNDAQLREKLFACVPEQETALAEQLLVWVDAALA